LSAAVAAAEAVKVLILAEVPLAVVEALVV
jgi:hypothetical protein